MADNHGNTPAAWTAVTVVLLGFLVGSVGLMIGNWPTFWVGVALVPVGGLLGLVMGKMSSGGSRVHPEPHSASAVEHDRA